LLSIAVALIYNSTNSIDRSVPFPPHPCQHFLLFVLLVIVLLTGIRQNLSVVLIFTSFMAKDGEHFFICLLAICTSFEIVCSINLSIYSVGCWFFVGLVFLRSLNIVVINLLSDV
jgi:hypothetical protein